MIDDLVAGMVLTSILGLAVLALYIMFYNFGFLGPFILVGALLSMIVIGHIARKLGF